MASGTRTTDTFTEGLRKLLSQITDLKMTDDVDLPFVINLETQVLNRLKQQGSDALNGVGPGPMAAGPGAMMAPGGGPMAPPAALGPPPPAFGPGPVPGLMAGPSMPNPDELRRILARPGLPGR
jgi:hypothetical protein